MDQQTVQNRLGKIMFGYIKLISCGKDIPESLQKTWGLICTSKYMRHVYRNEDQYLFNITEDIIELEKLGHITIIFKEDKNECTEN